MAISGKEAGNQNALSPREREKAALGRSNRLWKKIGRLPRPYEPLYTRGPSDGQLGDEA